jgi:hypothetical protein
MVNTVNTVNTMKLEAAWQAKLRQSRTFPGLQPDC